MANPNQEPLVTRMDIDDLFGNQDQSPKDSSDQTGILVTKLSIDEFTPKLPVSLEAQARVMYEIASQG